MIRAWLVAAAFAGILSVGAGAVAAHLAGGEPHAAELLRTGALYGMVHAAVLVGTAALAERRERPRLLLAIAGWSFALGIWVFSFSLFGLALTRWLWLAAATPFGGTALLVGWASLGLGALGRR
jgi:uncharacterized membrane protein YgdD (TMEM256/DUF423 family)